MSGSADPYYIAQEEVKAAVNKVKDMHEEWKDLLQRENTAKSSKFTTLHSELAGELQHLGYDLQDVTATIEMVEDNRERFKIDDSEIKKRKDFVKQCHQTVQDIKDSTSSRQTLDKIQADQRKAQSSASRDDEKSKAASRENQNFLNNQRQDQQQIISQQDEELTQLSKVAQRLGDTARTINVELQDQQKMLEELDEDIDRETEKLNFVMKKVGRLLKTSDSKQLCVVIALFVLFMVMMFLVINT